MRVRPVESQCPTPNTERPVTILVRPRTWEGLRRRGFIDARGVLKREGGFEKGKRDA